MDINMSMNPSDIGSLVVLPVIFLVICIIRSRKPQGSIIFGLIAVVAGALELIYVSAGALFVVGLLLNPNPPSLNGTTSLDYYGLTLFLPILVVIATASLALGTWSLAMKAKQNVR
ncbi:MAG: hypothetical protein NWF01_12495 [Candidatus Bathyarchaeota archaeon]|nr:hypothetical protein [Candidatus Bathyarchaeota archaeon]